MNLLRTFGFGEKRLLAEGAAVQGTVTAVKTCWWLKVNQSPARTHALEGAAFPHIIYFAYHTAGKDYAGSRYVSWARRCPQIREQILVRVDRTAPKKYAVEI